MVTEERNSLAKSLEDEWSVGRALGTRIEGVLLMSRFAFRVRLFVLRRIWRARLRPWSNGGGGGGKGGGISKAGADLF
jgi:hypothetical protein